MRTFCRDAIGLGTTVGAVEAIYGQSAHSETLEAAWAKADGLAPSQVTDKTRKLKAKQMDQFGDSAKGLGPPAIPCLQPRLGNERRNPFYFFDASPLLFHLDSSPASLEAVSDEALDEYVSWSLRILDKITRNNFCDDLRSH